MAKIIVKSKKASKSDDSSEPKKVKKFKPAVEVDDEEVEEATLAQSRPMTGKDQRKVLKSKSADALKRASIVAKAKARLEAADEDELSEDEIEEIVAETRRKLQKYGRVALTPNHKATSGLRKNGVRQAKIAVPEQDDSDFVRVVMMKTCDPAPRIGNIKIVEDHGHEKLEKGETYSLPRIAAVHLAESKAATMIDD